MQNIYSYLCVARQTDVKRARFREDAESDDDKLISCFELNCHNVRTRFTNSKKKAGAGANTSGRAKPARPPADEEDGGFEGTEGINTAVIARRGDVLSPKTKTKGKSKGKGTKSKGGNGDCEGHH
jgi:hypothetical protein